MGKEAVETCYDAIFQAKMVYKEARDQAWKTYEEAIAQAWKTYRESSGGKE